MHGAKKKACTVLLLKKIISPSFATSSTKIHQQRQDNSPEEIKQKQSSAITSFQIKAKPKKEVRILYIIISTI